jgi:hypothetical protein
MHINHFCALASACDSNTFCYHTNMVIMQAYASVQLNADLGLSDYVYGLGSGIFFLGYMFFQVCTFIKSRSHLFKPSMRFPAPNACCTAKSFQPAAHHV